MVVSGDRVAVGVGDAKWSGGLRKEEKELWVAPVAKIQSDSVTASFLHDASNQINRPSLQQGGRVESVYLPSQAWLLFLHSEVFETQRKF